MVKELNVTLHSAIKDHAHFNRIVSEAISIELKKLGPEIVNLDWASIAAHKRNSPSIKAA